MMLKMVYLLTLSIFFVTFYSFAQESKLEKTKGILIVSGKITDHNGLPLIGVNIIVKGTDKKCITNFDGKFSAEVEAGSVLSISSKGFIAKDILIEPNAEINFVLKENPSPFDLNPNEVSSSLTRTQIRKARKRLKGRNKDRGVRPEDVELIYGILRTIAK